MFKHPQAVRSDQSHAVFATYGQQLLLAGLALAHRSRRIRPRSRAARARPSAHTGGRCRPRRARGRRSRRGRHLQALARPTRRPSPTGPPSALGLTGWTGPLKAWESRLWKISPPTVPRFRPAPITATERGLRKWSSAAAAALLSRSSKRSMASGESDGRDLDQHEVGLRAHSNAEPALAEDLDHAVVLRQHLCLEHRDTLLLGRLGEMREQDRAKPLPLNGIGDLEGDLRPIGAGAFVDRVPHDSVVARPSVPGARAGSGSRPLRPISPPRVRSTPAEKNRSPTESVESPWRKRSRSSLIAGPHRAHMHSRAVA